MTAGLKSDRCALDPNSTPHAIVLIAGKSDAPVRCYAFVAMPAIVAAKMAFCPQWLRRIFRPPDFDLPDDARSLIFPRR
jgi:hypothetical protein